MKLTHPETKQTIDVRDDMADVYISQGWEPAKKADKPTKADD